MKFLYFGDGNNDAVSWPADNLITIQHTTDTSMKLFFAPSTGDADADVITLTIAAGSDPKAIIKAIGFAINKTVVGPSDLVIVVADNVGQEYIHSSVTDVATTLDT